MYVEHASDCRVAVGDCADCINKQAAQAFWLQPESNSNEAVSNLLRVAFQQLQT